MFGHGYFKYSWHYLELIPQNYSIYNKCKTKGNSLDKMQTGCSRASLRLIYPGVLNTVLNFFLVSQVPGKNIFFPLLRCRTFCLFLCTGDDAALRSIHQTSLMLDESQQGSSKSNSCYYTCRFLILFTLGNVLRNFRHCMH